MLIIKIRKISNLFRVSNLQIREESKLIQEHKNNGNVLAKHYLAQDILVLGERYSIHNSTQQVVTICNITDKVERDYALPYKHYDLIAYPGSLTWIGHDLDSNTIFTFDAASNTLRSIVLKQKYNIRVGSDNKIEFISTDGQSRIKFNNLDDLHAYMHRRHHKMKKSQAQLVQKRQSAEDKEEVKEEPKVKNRKMQSEDADDEDAEEYEEKKPSKVTTSLKPPAYFINLYIRVLKSKIDDAALKNSLKEFKFDKKFYTTLNEIEKGLYRKALQINIHVIQQHNLDEKISDGSGYIKKQFLKIMSCFEMITWVNNYISVVDKSKDVISLYSIKDNLIRDYKLPFENARIVALSHYWVGIDLNTKTLFTIDVISNKFQTIVLKETCSIKIDASNKIILSKPGKYSFSQEETLFTFNHIGGLHTFMSHRSPKKSQLPLIQKREINLQEKVSIEPFIQPLEKTYIKPPEFLFQTLFNSILEAKIDSKKIKSDLRNAGNPAYTLNSWDKEADEQFEKSLVKANLLQNKKPDENNLQQKNLRNWFINLRWDLQNNNASSSMIIQLIMILSLNIHKDKNIKLNLLSLIDDKFIKEPLLKLTSITKKDARRICTYISNKSGQRVIIRQLLINANIISEESVNNEQNICLDWILSISTDSLINHSVNKLDFMRLILQVTHKHTAIETVDFTPFILCGILDSDEVNKLIAQPANSVPIIQEILNNLKQRNEAISALFLPLFHAGEGPHESLYNNTVELFSILTNSIYDKDTHTQKEVLNLRFLPALNAIQQEEKVFDELYSLPCFDKNQLSKVRSQEVTQFLNTFYMVDHTLLSAATGQGNFEIFKLLLERGAKMKLRKKPKGYKYYIESTPLVGAARSGNIKIAKYLLENKVDVNQIERLGATALGSAAWNGHAEMVKLLLEQDSILLILDHQGHDSPMSSALRQGHITIINMLLTAMINKINQGRALLPKLPISLIMKIVSGLQELQNVSYPAPPFGAINLLDGWLENYKLQMVAVAIEKIHVLSRNLPERIEEREWQELQKQFLALIQLQKESLLTAMEEAKTKSPFSISTKDSDEESEENEDQMDGEIEHSFESVNKPEDLVKEFINSLISLKTSLDWIVRDDQEDSKQIDTFSILKSVVAQLMQHETTRYILKEKLASMFHLALQKNDDNKIKFLLELAKSLNADVVFYSKAIESAAYFARYQLLSELLQTSKPLDGNAIIEKMLTGLDSLAAHLHKGVLVAKSMISRTKAKTPVKVPLEALKQIGLVSTSDVSDPMIANYVLLKRFESTAEILLKSVVNVKSLAPKLASSLAEHFPSLVPVKNKLRIYTPYTSEPLYTHPIHTNIVLDLVKDKPWKNDLIGFKIFDQSELAKLKALFKSSEEHAKDLADPKLTMIGLVLKTSSGIICQAPYFVSFHTMYNFILQHPVDKTIFYYPDSLFGLALSLERDTIKTRFQIDDVKLSTIVSFQSAKDEKAKSKISKPSYLVRSINKMIGSHAWELREAKRPKLESQLRLHLIDEKEDPRYASAVSIGYCKPSPLLKISDWIKKQDRRKLVPDEYKWLEKLEQKVIDLEKGSGINQTDILNKLIHYCNKFPQEVKKAESFQQQARDPIFISSLYRGHCVGFTLLRTIGRLIDCQPVDEKAERPRDDTNFIVGVMRLLSDWNPDKGFVGHEKREFTKQEVANIERFLSLLVFLHTSSETILNGTQIDFLGGLNIINDEQKIPALASAYKLGGRLTKQESQEILHKILIAPQIKEDKEVKKEDEFLEILIFSHNHGFSIRKIGTKIEFEDPNISEPVQLIDTKMVSFLVFLASWFDEDKASPLKIHVITRKGVKLDLPKADVMFQEVRKKPVEPLDKSYCCGYSDLEAAIDVDSPESVQYFLKNGTQFNLLDVEGDNALWIALKRQRLQSIEVLLNYVVAKAPLTTLQMDRLMHLAINSPAKSLSLVLRYIKDPAQHEDAMKRSVDIGDPQKLEYLLKHHPLNEQRSENLLKFAAIHPNPVFSKIVAQNGAISSRLLREMIDDIHTATPVKNILELEFKRITQPRLLAATSSFVSVGSAEEKAIFSPERPP